MNMNQVAVLVLVLAIIIITAFVTAYISYTRGYRKGKAEGSMEERVRFCIDRAIVRAGDETGARHFAIRPRLLTAVQYDGANAFKICQMLGERHEIYKMDTNGIQITLQKWYVPDGVNPNVFITPNDWIGVDEWNRIWVVKDECFKEVFQNV